MPIRNTAIPFRQTGRFAALFCNYVENHPGLIDFQTGFPDMENFKNSIPERLHAFPQETRKLLHRLLDEQTRSATFHPEQEKSLEKLAADNCLTVSCGHQLCIGGGPQYMLFKILSTIRLAEELQQRFPEQPFVPVFWMAGEDHDIDEIRQLSFFGREYSLNIEGSGPCGRLSTAGIAAQLREIPDFPEEMALFYEDSENLNEATRKWLHHYFGNQGLLVLNADHSDLKRIFLPEMLAEFSGPALATEVRQQTSRLEKLGYSAQLHCRDLNLFYMETGLRSRLEKTATGIRTADGRKEWTQEEALAFFPEHPETLSPNAVLRPLYSQKILPDIAFVGGPAEIAYWLQLKTAFSLHGIFFPLLIPRFSALLLPHSRMERLQKLGLLPEDLFLDAQTLRRKIALGDEQIPEPGLKEAFSGLLAFARSVDPGTADSLEADLRRLEDQAANMVRKARRAAEKKSETQLIQLEKLLEYCFPDGGLLERKESWLSTMVQNPSLMVFLRETIHPIDFQFQVREII
jgi:bacillithiol biosynthesis cysteine-adding enzyme BshC